MLYLIVTMYMRWVERRAKQKHAFCGDCFISANVIISWLWQNGGGIMVRDVIVLSWHVCLSDMKAEICTRSLMRMKADFTNFVFADTIDNTHLLPKAVSNLVPIYKFSRLTNSFAAENIFLNKITTLIWKRIQPIT